MKRPLDLQAENLIIASKRRSRLRRGVALLSAFVMLFTMNSLKLDADTLERTPMCGLEAHAHTAACYPLVCGLTEAEPEYETRRVYVGGFKAHRHTDDCLDDEGNLACGYVEGEYWHTHNRWCYDDDGKLTCGLKERKPHEHTDACYEDVATLACGLEEFPAHTHTDACYTERRELVCELKESAGHRHTDDCYEEYDELTCGKKESAGHRHSDDCYKDKKELTCGLKESAGHEHTDDCYAEFTRLTCDKVEGPGHEHTEDCYRLDLVCGLLETEEHQHTDECYEKVLVCGMEEGEGAHTHTKDCYTVTRVLACGKEKGEGAHTHDEDCYTHHRDLICGMEEGEGAHTHGDGCYITHYDLTCGEEETPGHKHTDDCYIHHSEQVCGRDEAERVAAKLGVEDVTLHHHTDKCFTTVTREVDGEERALRFATCGCLEIPAFTSSEDDWTDVPVLVSAGHRHTDDCYDMTAEPICGVQEHEHTDACYQQRPVKTEEPEEPEATEAPEGDGEAVETEATQAPGATDDQGEPESEDQGEVEDTDDQGEKEGSDDQGEPEAEDQDEEEKIDEQGEPEPEEQGEEEKIDEQGEPESEEQGEEESGEQGEEKSDEQGEAETDVQDEAPAVEEETRSASVSVDLSSVDLMDAATIQGRTVKLSVSDLLEARDDAVSVEGELDVDHKTFAENAEVTAADVRIQDGVITLPVKALDRGSVSLQMQTEETDEEENVTAVTTQTVDIELTGYAGRTDEVVQDNVAVKADVSTSLPADAVVTVTENAEVPEGILTGDDTAPSGTVEGASAYEITITNDNGDVIAETGAVSVTVIPTDVNIYENVPSGATVKGVSYALYHSHDGGAPAEIPVDVETDENGNVTGFRFETDSFSTYVLKYTVDFEYNGFEWSLPGEGIYPISDILEMIGVGETYDDVSLRRVIDKGGSDNALYLNDEHTALISEEAFRDTYELTIIAGHDTYILTVTDDLYNVDSGASRITISSANANPYTATLVSDTVQYDENEQRYSATFRVDFVIPAQTIQTDGYNYEIPLGDVIIPNDYLDRTYIAKDGSDTSFYYKYVKVGDNYKILIDYNMDYITDRIAQNEPIKDNYIEFNCLIKRIKESTESEEVIAVTDTIDVHIPDSRFDYPENEDKNHSINGRKDFIEYTVDQSNIIHIRYKATINSEKGTYESIHVSDTVNTNVGGWNYWGDSCPVIDTSEVTIQSVVKKNASGGSTDVTGSVTGKTVTASNEGKDVTLTYDLPGLNAGESYEVTYEYVYDKAFLNDTGYQAALQDNSSTTYWINYYGNNNMTVETGENPLVSHGSGSYSVIRTNGPVDVNKWGEYKQNDGQIEWTIYASFNDASYHGPYRVVDAAFVNCVSGSMVITDGSGNAVELGSGASLSGNTLTFSAPGYYTVKYRTPAPAANPYQNTTVTNNATGYNDEQHTEEKQGTVIVPPNGTISKNLVSGTAVTSGSDGDGSYTAYTYKWHVSIPIPAGGFPEGTKFTDTMTAYLQQQGWKHYHLMIDSQQNAFKAALEGQMPGAQFDAGTYTQESNESSVYVLKLTQPWVPDSNDNRETLELEYETRGKVYPATATPKSSSSSSGDTYTNTLTVGDVSSSAKWEYTKLLQKKAYGGSGSGTTTTRTITRSGDRELAWDIVVTWDGDYSTADIVDTLPAGLRLSKIGIGDEYQPVMLYRETTSSNIYMPTTGYDGLGNAGNTNMGTMYSANFQIRNSQNLGLDENNRVWPVATVTGTPGEGQTVSVHLELTGERPYLFSSGARMIVRIWAYVEDDQFIDFVDQSQNPEQTVIKNYANTVTLSTNDNPRGRETQTQVTTLVSDVLKKGETHSNFEANHEIDYVIDINKDGHRLLPVNSTLETLTLEDDLTYLKNTDFDFTVNLDLNSVKLYEKVGNQWVEYNDPSAPWVFTFEETSDPSNSQQKIKKLRVRGIPDEKILQLRYKYVIDVTNAQVNQKYTIPAISNKAVLKGAGHTGSSTFIEREEISFNTSAGTISGKNLRLTKVDSQNNRVRVANAKFILEKYTSSGWTYVPAIENPDVSARMRTDTWTNGGTNYTVYVTNDVGVLEISQPVGSPRFEENTAYRVREIEAPEGYTLDSQNPPIAYFYFAAVGSTVSPVPTEPLWSKADNLKLESDHMTVNNDKVPELIITKTFAGEEISPEAKNNITFTVTGPNSYNRLIQLSDSGFNYDATTGVYTYRLRDNIVDDGVYTVTETNMDVNGVNRVTTYSVNSKPALEASGGSSAAAENIRILYSSGRVDFKNIYGTTEITANKVWMDQNDLAGARPAQIQLQLKRDGANYGAPVAVTAPSWSYQWTGLPADHTYTVEELPVNGYSAAVVYTQNGQTEQALTGDGSVTVTNTLTGIHVRKVWDPVDQADATDIYVKLEYYDESDGTWKVSIENYNENVTLNSANDWHYCWEGRDAGLTYRVTETGVNPSNAGDKFVTVYSVNGGAEQPTVSGDVGVGGVVVITNTRKPSISASKVWVDDTQTDHTQDKFKLYVRLQRKPKSDSNAEWESVDYDRELSSANSWTTTWDALQDSELYDYRVLEKSNTGVYLEEGQDLNIRGVHYRVSYTDENGDTVETILPGHTVTVTNTRLPGIVVNKVWTDGAAAHAADVVGVYLKRWDETYSRYDVFDNVSYKTLTRANNWTATWEGLLPGKYELTEANVYDGGDTSSDIVSHFNIAYSVTDPDNQITVGNTNIQPGSAVTVTNTEKLGVKVVKAWVGDPMDEIYVKLEKASANNPTSWQAVSDYVKLDASTDPAWTYEWDHLDAADASGNAYTYRAQEYTENEYNNKVPISGYTVAYSVTNSNGDVLSTDDAAVPGQTITITNTKTPGIEVRKVWVDGQNHSSDSDSIWVCLRRRLSSANNDWGWQETKPVELNEGNSWHHKWDNLDAEDESGDKWVYKVTEYPTKNIWNNADDISGYTVSYSVTNGHTQDTVELGDTVTITNTKNTDGIAVCKRWNVENDTDIKPVTIQLREGSLSQGDDTYKLTINYQNVYDSNNTWTETLYVEKGTAVALKWLNNYNENNYTSGGTGCTHSYSNGELSITPTENNAVFSLYCQNEKSSLTFDYKPVVVMSDGDAVVDTVTLNSANNWYKEWTTETEPAWQSGKYYYIVETAVDSVPLNESIYVPAYLNNGIRTGTITVTNSKETTTGSLSITKAVAGDDATQEAAASQDFNFSVTLTPPLGVTLDTNGFSATGGTITWGTADANGAITGTFTITGLGTVTIGGIPVGTTYVVEETDPTSGWVQDGEVEYGNEGKTITANATDEVTVTNTEAMEITVNKVWMLNGVTVEASDTPKSFGGTDITSISFDLYQKVDGETKGTKYGQTHTLTAEGNWTETISDLPKYTMQGGQLKTLSYYLVEDMTTDLQHYNATIAITSSGEDNGTEVTNANPLGYTAAVTITNSLYTVQLPATGGTGTRPYYVAGAGLMVLAVLGYILLNRKRSSGDGI